VKLIYEQSSPGRPGTALPAADVPPAPLPPPEVLRLRAAALPEVSEFQVVRHFTRLSSLNYSLDADLYPLGSCTMKYNPKAAEAAAALEGFCGLHPATVLLPGGAARAGGALRLMAGLQEMLAEITGMDAVSLQPLAGAQGELAGLLMVRAYHRARGRPRKYVIVPDTAHGTNPASAAQAGYEILTVPTGADGQMDYDAFREVLDEETAAVMMTCPNTLGIFNTRIADICRAARAAGALMYYDGANLNAVLGRVRPGDVGFDVVHLNLHKTFGAPHGGGGPGSGPVCVKAPLAPYLPVPVVERRPGGEAVLVGDRPESIGRLAAYYGNFSVLVKAYAYILLLGGEGLAEAAQLAVLNANYLQALLRGRYDLPYDRTCMHECVFSASRQEKNGVHALDIAKYLIEAGIHPPTVYFPLIVKEAMMIEPTETETREALDEFVRVMTAAAELAETDPGRLRAAPVGLRRGRLDEVRAARELDVNFVEE